MAIRWTQEVEGGPRRVNHAAVSIRNRFIFSFGGYCTGEEYNQIVNIDVHVFDTVQCRWMKPPPVSCECKGCVPYMRYGHSASAMGDLVYIFGGRNDTHGACNILYCFDTRSLTWSKPKVNGKPPAARDGHSACVIESRIYIFGGYEEEGECFSNSIEYLDTQTLTWHQPRVTGEPAKWRDFHSATAVGTNMYIFGGRGDRLGQYHSGQEVYSSSVRVFDTVKNCWFKLNTSGNVPIGRRSHSAVAYGKHVYVFGGYNGIEKKHYGEVFSLDTDTNVWTKLDISGHGPCPRRRHCCCLIGTRLMIFGGTSPAAGEPADDEYHLQDHSDLYILDLEPSLRTLCKLAVIQYKLDQTPLPKVLKTELSIMEAGRSSVRSSQG
ncbi:kelch domain-containing protein 3 isoform X1 [Pocillopora verrucosa]|uniref:kelch domain-containing protein 3-like isoform X1 n=1 Tax=Pocillopora damicornis TaxID=46731 RepID=UPI000F5556D7|nr:kelch domain-containing protein 3-like isoform X1 [Pocillopora damicornis]XP_058968527.1 kelch domain-containing protein 3-like isoform X1 [Pocillopora verrucosa]